MTLAECVNVWFEATGRKQNDVAKRAGMLPSKISEIVNGKNDDPQFSTVEKIAKGFGVSPARFLDGPPGLEGDSRHGPVGNVGGGEGLADSLRRAVADYEKTGQFPPDFRGDIMLAIFTLTRALQRSPPAANVGEQVKEAQR